MLLEYRPLLIVYVSWSMRLPESLVILRTLSGELRGPCQRKEGFIPFLKFLQPATRLFFGLVDTVDFDTMA